MDVTMIFGGLFAGISSYLFSKWHVEEEFLSEARGYFSILRSLEKKEDYDGIDVFQTYFLLIACLNCGQATNPKEETKTILDPRRIGLTRSGLERLKVRVSTHEARRLLAVLRAGEGKFGDIEELWQHLIRSDNFPEDIETDTKELTCIKRQLEISRAKELFETCFLISDPAPLQAAFHFIEERGIKLRDLKLDQHKVIAAIERAGKARRQGA